jgi:hypothetical protein
VAIFSEEMKHVVDEVVVCTDVAMEDEVPLSGLNMQLKRIQDDACTTVDKGQRWSLFETQCFIKGKLIVRDGDGVLIPPRRQRQQSCL